MDINGRIDKALTRSFAKCSLQGSWFWQNSILKFLVLLSSNWLHSRNDWGSFLTKVDPSDGFCLTTFGIIWHIKSIRHQGWWWRWWIRKNLHKVVLIFARNPRRQVNKPILRLNRKSAEKYIDINLDLWVHLFGDIATCLQQTHWHQIQCRYLFHDHMSIHSPNTVVCHWRVTGTAKKKVKTISM